MYRGNDYFIAHFVLINNLKALLWGVWFLHMVRNIMEQQKEALRSLIVNCFSGILSGDQHQIRDAEGDMKALEIKEGSSSVCYW